MIKKITMILNKIVDLEKTEASEEDLALSKCLYTVAFFLSLSGVLLNNSLTVGKFNTYLFAVSVLFITISIFVDIYRLINKVKYKNVFNFVLSGFIGLVLFFQSIEADRFVNEIFQVSPSHFSYTSSIVTVMKAIEMVTPYVYLFLFVISALVLISMFTNKKTYGKKSVSMRILSLPVLRALVLWMAFLFYQGFFYTDPSKVETIKAIASYVDFNHNHNCTNSRLKGYPILNVGGDDVLFNDGRYITIATCNPSKGHLAEAAYEAFKGSASAEEYVGNIVAIGKGADQNFEESSYWLKKIEDLIKKKVCHEFLISNKLGARHPDYDIPSSNAQQKVSFKKPAF